MDSSVTISIPSAISRAASASTAPMVAATVHTVLRRTGPRRVRRAGAHHPRRLGHIDRGDPLKDPLVLLISITCGLLTAAS